MWKIAAHYATNMGDWGMCVSGSPGTMPFQPAAFSASNTNYLICHCEEHSELAISAGPTGPFVLSLSKDRLRVFSLIEIANLRIEYGVAMTKWVRMSMLLR